MATYVNNIEKLGNRIAIIGPSSSGKSTLAYKIGKQFSIPAFHLDQLAYIPNTNWEMKAFKDFQTEHQKIIGYEKWVIDGNYGKLMRNRFEAATGIIWLNFSLHSCLYRYTRRCILHNKTRFGGLVNAKREFNLKLLFYIIKSHVRVIPPFMVGVASRQL